MRHARGTPLLDRTPPEWGELGPAAEDVASRTQDAKHYRIHGSATRRLGLFRPWQHYHGMDGAWHDVDLALREERAGLWEAARGPLRTRLADAILELREPESGWTVRWTFPRPPIVDGRRFRFSDGGIEWTYTHSLFGIKAEGLVRAPLGRQAVSFLFHLAGPGRAELEVHASEDGPWLSAGLVRLAALRITGADGLSYPVAAWELGPGGRPVMVLDDRNLPAAAYPYVIDPTTTFTLAASADNGHVGITDSAGGWPPAGSVSVFEGGQSNEIRVNGHLLAPNTQNFKGLMRWDTSSIPNDARILSATLRIYALDFESVDGKTLSADWYTAWPIDADDYVFAAQTGAFSGLAISSVPNNADKDVALSAPEANISKTGYTGLRVHVSTETPTGRNGGIWAAFGHAQAAPRLIVEYDTGMPLAKFKVFTDWDADLDWNDANEELTADVRRLVFEHFRDLHTDYMEAATVQVELRNDTHKYSPPKGTIPTANLVPGRALWVQAWYPWDDFSGASGSLVDHTPDRDSNYAWTNYSGGTNGFVLTSTGDARIAGTSTMTIMGLNFSDPEVEVAAYLTPTGLGTANPGLVGRLVNGANYLWVEMPAAGTLELHRMSAGLGVTLATGTLTWNEGTKKHLAFQLHGTWGRVIVDNAVIVATSIDSGTINTGTVHGLFHRGTAPTGNLWHEFGGYRSLFYGPIDSITPRPERGNEHCVLVGMDLWEQFKGHKLRFANTTGTADRRSDQILSELLDTMDHGKPWAGGAAPENLENGATVLVVTAGQPDGLKSVDDDLLTAIYRLQDEEDGFIYQDGHGHMTFEKLAHRSTAPHTASVGTFKDSSTGTSMVYAGFEWSDGRENVENQWTMAVTPGTKGGSGTVVWSHPGASPTSVLIFGSGTADRFYLAELTGTLTAADAWVTPSATTDYQAFTDAAGIGTNITAGVTVTFASAQQYAGRWKLLQVSWGTTTAGYLTKFQLRATPRTEGDVTEFYDDNATSIATYGARPKRFAAQYIDRDYLADALLGNRATHRKDPRTLLRLAVPPVTRATVSGMIQRRLSDRVTVLYSTMGVTGDYYIEGYAWDVSDGETQLLVTYQLRKI